jgi:hypothetical protein
MPPSAIPPIIAMQLTHSTIPNTAKTVSTFGSLLAARYFNDAVYLYRIV